MVSSTCGIGAPIEIASLRDRVGEGDADELCGILLTQRLERDPGVRQGLFITGGSGHHGRVQRGDLHIIEPRGDDRIDIASDGDHMRGQIRRDPVLQQPGNHSMAAPGHHSKREGRDAE